MGRQKVRTFLADLEGERAITQESATGLTQGRRVITICKYDEYQVKGGGSNPSANPPPTHSQPTKEQGNNNNNLPPSEEAVASEPVQVSVLTTAMWNATKQYLGSQGVPNPGAMIGRWLKSHGPMEIINAADQAQRAGTQDPVPYITRILTRKETSKSDLDELFAAVKSGERR